MPKTSARLSDRPLDDMSAGELNDLMQETVQAMARTSEPAALNGFAAALAFIGQAMGAAAAASWISWNPGTPITDSRPSGHADVKLQTKKSKKKSKQAAPAEPVAQRVPAPRAEPKVPVAVRETEMTMYGIREPKPGERWKALFDAVWPAYKRWYLSDDGRTRPSRKLAVAKLRKHMPELMPTYTKMVELAGHDETAARMLTLWDPPRFLPGCSQAVITEPEHVLARNYDYSPDLFECVVYSSEFTGRKVIGTGDCLWGLLDGMNDAGFTVSLTFGGISGSGPGFAIPIVVRYLLEVCETIDDAKAVLERLPISMSYNLTMIDATGQTITAFVGPGRKPEYFSAPLATNHRGDTPDNPEHARRFRSVERRNELKSLVAEDPSVKEIKSAFLSPPLYSDNFSGAFGTLYTAIYRPQKGVVEYVWPDRTWKRTFADADDTVDITLRQHSG